MSIISHYMEREKLMNKGHNFLRTKAEQKMADALKKNHIKYEHNYLLEGYEVDFWIEEAGLILEIDGFYHLSNNKTSSDRAKDRKMNEKGYTVIRFENRQIDNDLGNCISLIKNLIIKTKTYRNKDSILVNSDWKESLEPLKQKMKSIEAKEKKAQNIEEYFLNIERDSE